MSTLYVVATPIGNLKYITLRALDVLKSTEIIASEDTRTTRNLLNHFNIADKRLLAIEAHNEAKAAKGIINLMDDGNDICYVTEAGTPGVSDPGARLAEEVMKNGYKVVPLPGCSASVTLISAAGNVGKSWHFEGFLPKTSGKRDTRLKELFSRDEAFIIYESHYRILKTLEALSTIDGERIAVIGRELTKMHEEIQKDTIGNLYEDYKNRNSIKGEFVIIVCPDDKKKRDDD